jgi:hypothetical protein
MLKVASLLFGDKIIPRPSEFNRLSRVFSKAGGSWKRLFHGSVEDTNLLKTVMKVAFKSGYLTKKEKWT